MVIILFGSVKIIAAVWASLIFNEFAPKNSNNYTRSVLIVCLSHKGEPGFKIFAGQINWKYQNNGFKL